MSSTETAEAAADLASLFIDQAAAQGDPNALRLKEQGQPEVVAAAPAQVSSTSQTAAEAAPEAAAPEAETVEPEIPSFEPDLPEDLAALLDEPDIDAEVEAEIAAEQNEYDENYDPDEARRIKKLEKRAAWLEGQLVAKSRSGWVAENLRAYPLLATYAADDVKAIQATSRRGFAREAAALNERYMRVLKPAIDDIAKAKAALKAEATDEARAEVAQAWGKPIGDGGAAAPDAMVAALDKARADRAPLIDRIKILMGAPNQGR